MRTPCGGLPLSGVHVNTAATLRPDAGATVEAGSAFLAHSSLATTSIYLKRLEGQRDHRWSAVAEAVGIE